MLHITYTFRHVCVFYVEHFFFTSFYLPSATTCSMSLLFLKPRNCVVITNREGEHTPGHIIFGDDPVITKESALFRRHFLEEPTKPIVLQECIRMDGMSRYGNKINRNPTSHHASAARLFYSPKQDKEACSET